MKVKSNILRSKFNLLIKKLYAIQQQISSIPYSEFCDEFMKDDLLLEDRLESILVEITETIAVLELRVKIL